MARKRYNEPIKDELSKLMFNLYQRFKLGRKDKQIGYYFDTYNGTPNQIIGKLFDIYEENGWVEINDGKIKILDSVPTNDQGIIEEVYDEFVSMEADDPIEELEPEEDGGFYVVGSNTYHTTDDDDDDDDEIYISDEDVTEANNIIEDNVDSEIEIYKPDSITPKTHIIVQYYGSGQADVFFSDPDRLDEGIEKLINSGNDDIHIFKLHKTITHKIEEINYGNSNKRYNSNIWKIFDKIRSFLVRSMQNVQSRF